MIDSVSINNNGASMADNTVRGRFVWHELITPNGAGAHEFYGKTLGWAKQGWDQQPSYQMFTAASGPLGATVEKRDAVRIGCRTSAPPTSTQPSRPPRGSARR
jgi:hypothetical protein